MARSLRQSFAAQARMARDRFLGLLKKDTRATEGAVLRQCLAPNAETAFGREHGFARIADSRRVPRGRSHSALRRARAVD